MSPTETRDASRLLVLKRDTGERHHATFRRLLDELMPRSLIVLNDTRVMAARLSGTKPTGGALEVLLVRPSPTPARAALAEGAADAARSDAAENTSQESWHETWDVLAKNLGGLPIGARARFGPDVEATLVARGDRGSATLRFSGRGPGGLLAASERIGAVPLPPYIEAARKRLSAVDTDGHTAAAVDDRDRYQTVFARVTGAVAAPTAGLHFTPELLADLRARGHELAWLTLHVGPGTFRSVEVDDPAAHVMDAERYHVSDEAARALNAARAEGRPIVAVGTTVVRTLESLASSGEVRAGEGTTDLFIRPGFAFRMVTDLVTNFHLPRSTLLMLVCAFAGREPVLAAYADAIERGYRFYSYGDAMFIRGTGART